MSLDNPNPQVKTIDPRVASSTPLTYSQKLFDVIRDIRDPEHPHSLEELSVITGSSLSIIRPPSDSPGYGKVTVTFNPTVPHCSLASIIGLCIILKLTESGLLTRGDHYYKLSVRCEGHVSENDINKQLKDKERVSAAFENQRIMGMINGCIEALP